MKETEFWREKAEKESPMALPERSKPLHNFSLPYLKWGNQRFLRCIKIAENSEPKPEFPAQIQFQAERTKNSPLKNKDVDNPSQESHNGDEAVRQKLMLDLIVAEKKLEVSILEHNGDIDSSTRWNLRTRREERRSELGVLPRRQSLDRKEKMKFWVSLAKEEVEEDFVTMVGRRPPRRPKKRARIVQKNLDSIFPGLCLMEITLDSYKVRDVPE